MVEAFLGLGGNVGDSRAILNRAIAMLGEDAGIKLAARSSAYLTPAWGVQDQPPFVNLCVAIETTLSPHQLLDSAQAVERQLGRDRGAETRWGPRTCDVDILIYDDLTLCDARLTLPHPRIAERGFVLMPLAEIAPDRVVAGKQVRDWLGAVDTAGIQKLPR